MIRDLARSRMRIKLRAVLFRRGTMGITQHDQFCADDIREAIAVLGRERYRGTYAADLYRMVHVVDDRHLSDYELLQLAERERRLYTDR